MKNKEIEQFLNALGLHTESGFAAVIPSHLQFTDIIDGTHYLAFRIDFKKKFTDCKIIP